MPKSVERGAKIGFEREKGERSPESVATGKKEHEEEEEEEEEEGEEEKEEEEEKAKKQQKKKGRWRN